MSPVEVEPTSDVTNYKSIAHTRRTKSMRPPPQTERALSLRTAASINHHHASTDRQIAVDRYQRNASIHPFYNNHHEHHEQYKDRHFAWLSPHLHSLERERKEQERKQSRPTGGGKTNNKLARPTRTYMITAFTPVVGRQAGVSYGTARGFPHLLITQDVRVRFLNRERA